MNMNMMNNDLYGSYLTKTFCDVWGDAESFITDVKESGMFTVNALSDTSLTTIYYLLYAKYGNSHIANSDENQFKYRVYSILFTQGAAWEKRVEIQQTLRQMSEDELRKSSTNINNHSYNPATPPATSSDEALPYIDAQDQNHKVKSRIEGYATLLTLLEDDITTQFIDSFKPLFISFVLPQVPLWYTTELLL